MPNFRSLFAALAAGLLACTGVCAQPASAAWPAKPIRIIVPFAPGAFTDASARLLAKELSSRWGSQ